MIGRPHRCSGLPKRRWLGIVGLVFATFAGPVLGHAQDPLSTNDYAVEISNGPVLAGGRVVGLAGAYTALAAGIEAAGWNPAAYGSRYPHEFDWFEWDVDLGIMLPGTFSANDYFNNDQGDGVGTDSFLFLDLGLRLQLGSIGIGNAVRVQTYEVEHRGNRVDTTVTTNHAGLGYAVDQGQMIIGAGIRTIGLTMATGSTELVSFGGTGIELGILLRPEGHHYRFGGAFRFPFQSTEVGTQGVETIDGVEQAAGFVIPSRVVVPWEAQAGIAYQFGPRAFNQRWNPDTLPARQLRRKVQRARYERLREQTKKELEQQGLSYRDDGPYEWLPRLPKDEAFWKREERIRAEEDKELEHDIELAEEELESSFLWLPRRYLLLTADVILTGPSQNAVGVDAFMAQEHRPAGERLTAQVRLGAESELVRNLLRLRIGGYLEPSRYQTVDPRLHGTAGFDVRLFRIGSILFIPGFDVRFTASADLAPRYFNWGLALGFWH